jgi:RNA polymerase sigma factor (sigma-70 family)
MKKISHQMKYWDEKLAPGYFSYCNSKGYEFNRDSQMEYLLSGPDGAPKETAIQLVVQEVYSKIISWQHKLGYELADSSVEFEDIVMEFVSGLIEGVKKLNYTCTTTSFDGYLFTVFRNYLLDVMRKEVAIKRFFQNNKNKTAMENLNQLPESVESYLNANQVKAVMESFCQDPDMILVFGMIYIEECDIKEVIRATGYSQAKVYRINARINDFLKSNIVRDRITLLYSN